ncbi:MAG: DUF1990 domain-containing protein [Planctomycetes bacterium]|nr:DUF1990 domain-containing protein [Planctomycetota bacterium]
MYSFRRPPDEQIRRFLREQAELDFSYAEVGATAGEPPAGFQHHEVRVPLGQGENDFEAAKAALRRWAEFDTGWTELCWPDAPPAPGQTVAVIARRLGVRLLNACRIIYVVDEPNVFGFAYGTLPHHAEQGEERFQVRRRPEDDTAWYEVTAFFRPNLRTIRLAWPLVQRLVNQFRNESAKAMQHAVRE